MDYVVEAILGLLIGYICGGGLDPRRIRHRRDMRRDSRAKMDEWNERHRIQQEEWEREWALILEEQSRLNA